MIAITNSSSGRAKGVMFLAAIDILLLASLEITKPNIISQSFEWYTINEYIEDFLFFEFRFY